MTDSQRDGGDETSTVAAYMPRRSDITELRPVPLRADPHDPVLHDVVQRIRGLAPGNSLNDVLQIGELVFREVYGGERVLLRRGPQHRSLRRLAAHPDVPIKLTTLWRAVAVYEMSLRFPQLFEHPELGVSHFRAVIGLPMEQQRQLLENAARERWTKRRLEAEVARCRGEHRRGRKPLPKLLKWARELDRMLERSSGFTESELQLRGNAAKETRSALERFRTHCQELESLMPPPSSRRGQAR